MTWEQAVLWLRAQSDQADLVRACFYDDPLVAAAERYHQSTEWAAVQALLSPNRGRALDIGAGRGITSYALARDGWRTTAIEPDPSPIVGAGAIAALAEATGLKIDLVEQPAESLPFAASTFELVLCRAVLHHARDLAHTCREIHRVLRPGGTLLAMREHVISRAEDLPRFLAAHPLHRLYGGEHAYLLGDYQGAIAGAGLHLLKALNPYESDINLFPDTQRSLKQRMARRAGLPSAEFMPTGLLRWLGACSHRPGRHYSFLAVKPSDA